MLFLSSGKNNPIENSTVSRKSSPLFIIGNSRCWQYHGNSRCWQYHGNSRTAATVTSRLRVFYILHGPSILSSVYSHHLVPPIQLNYFYPHFIICDQPGGRRGCADRDQPCVLNHQVSDIRVLFLVRKESLLSRPEIYVHDELFIFI